MIVHTEYFGEISQFPAARCVVASLIVLLTRPLCVVCFNVKATAQEPEPVLQVDFGPTIEACLDTTFGLAGDPISDYNCDGCGAKVC
jgi:hypothetical protein